MTIFLLKALGVYLAIWAVIGIYVAAVCIALDVQWMVQHRRVR